MSIALEKKSWFAAAACALAGAAVFQFFGNATHGYIDTNSLFYWWGFQWFDPRSETEHGPLILAVSAWLLWRNLTKSEGTGAGHEAAWPAIVAMAAGLTLHVVGFAAQQTRVSILALLVFLWGLARLAGGKRWSDAAVFPLGFLVFAIPINAIDEVGLPLRLQVVKAGAWIVHRFGIDVVRTGTQLFAPDGRFNYDVAAPCSGVRSLVALAALALLVGYLNFRGWVRRGLVLLLCFPLVYLGNVARITSIIFAAQWLGPAWGERAHAVMGYGVFVIVLGGVMAAVVLMQRWWPETAESICHPLGDKRSGINSEEKILCHPIGDKWVWGMAFAVVVIAAGEMLFLKKLSSLPPRGATGVLLAAGEKNPADLPAFLGIEWTGRPERVTQAELDILPPDTGYSRRLYFNHRDPTKQVLVSIVLSGRDRTSIHRPELCLVGQGWTIAGKTQHTLRFPGRDDAAFPATVLSVQRELATPRGREVVPQLVAYWFVGGDTVVATHWQRLACDAWNRVVHARADRWAYVVVQTDARDGEAAALARMQAVLNETLPAFQKVFAPQKH